MEFYNSSDKAKNIVRGRKVGESKYPWVQVPIGKSFTVPRDNIKFDVLRSLASRTGKKLGKFFRVVDHGSGPYEVACLPMTDTEAVQKSSNVVEALNNTAKTTGPDQHGFIYDEKGNIIRNVNVKDEE